MLAVKIAYTAQKKIDLSIETTLIFKTTLIYKISEVLFLNALKWKHENRLSCTTFKCDKNLSQKVP